jgi:hypothetical protein
MSWKYSREYSASDSRLDKRTPGRTVLVRVTPAFLMIVPDLPISAPTGRSVVVTSLRSRSKTHAMRFNAAAECQGPDLHGLTVGQSSAFIGDRAGTGN